MSIRLEFVSFLRSLACFQNYPAPMSQDVPAPRTEPSPHPEDQDRFLDDGYEHCMYDWEKPPDDPVEYEAWLREKEVDLDEHVMDWKGLSLKDLGPLKRFDTVPIFTSHQPDIKLFRVYLFEKMLICAKEKQISLAEMIERGVIPPDQVPFLPEGEDCVESVYMLQGRIFGNTMTDVVTYTTPQTYVVETFWKDDQGVHRYFSMHFEHEKDMKNWGIAMARLRSENAPRCIIIERKASPGPTTSTRMMV